MPLAQGNTQAVISKNIAELVRAGHNQAQAEAIAYKEAGKTKDTMRFYIEEQLSENLSKTPEGFLICHDVVIARTGTQLYSDEEVPIESQNGLVHIDRPADEVFRPETIASFIGKPVTNNHPPVMVDVDNYKKYSIGHSQNVRRGEGIADRFLIADLIITDAKAIKAILDDGKREISCGYDAEYIQTSLGKGYQSNIIGNHIALVDKGRCGDKCSITDKELNMSKIKDEDATKMLGDPTEAKEVKGGKQDEREELKKTDVFGEKFVSKDDFNKFKDEIMEAIKAKKEEKTDDEEVEEKEKKEKSEDEEYEPEEKGEKSKSKDKKSRDDDKEDEGEETADEEEEEEGKGKKRVEDTALKLRSRGAILAPQIKLGSFDALDKKAFLDTARHFKIAALRAAMVTNDGKASILPFLKGKTPAFDKMSCGMLDHIFIGASELKREKNNAKLKLQSAIRTGDSLPITRQGNVDLNAIAAKLYNKKQ